MLDDTLRWIRTHIIPKKIFDRLNPLYHYSLSLIGATLYGFPSKKIKVIAVTGTKGKSSTTEIINAIFETAGYKTAVSNTIRFKIDRFSTDNKYKMSTPGRFFLQRFIRRAVRAKCDFVILELTSQSVLTYRNKWIDLDTFVFLNISPEHIDAHGSYDNYLKAKIAIGKEIENSKKHPRTVIANSDDKESPKFLDIKSDIKCTFSTKDLEPYDVQTKGLKITVSGQMVHSPLSGLFNVQNIGAAIATARAHGIGEEIIRRAIQNFNGIKGRVERINEGQNFEVVVDYAHTPDSLEKFYQVFQGSRNICVLGGTGGGRDRWKRKEMGKISAKYCEEIILADEDPYDEDPMQIINDVNEGVTESGGKATIILDRRLAIREALKRATPGDAVLITGKGTDPYIMGPNGTKKPWSDAEVAREELKNIGAIL